MNDETVVYAALFGMSSNNKTNRKISDLNSLPFDGWTGVVGRVRTMTDGRTEGCTDGQTDGRTDGQGGRTNGCTDGRTDAWTDGRTDRAEGRSSW